MAGVSSKKKKKKTIHTPLARYERNLASFGSSTVVRFSGADCSGCPYSMPAVEADRVKGLATGTLADCSECGRLVVR